ncbi:MAG: Hsp70 family protein [Chlamydiota bacterium]|nr:Hsp70 family protein [Chlamydiota bacterium]
MKYIVGIDLGTTNTCVSYIDTTSKTLSAKPFHIPQLVEAGFLEGKSSLPSYCYLASDGELPEGALELPWSKTKNYTVGSFALKYGAKVPTSLVSSAKSWLCHGSAQQKEAILPIDARDEKMRISPLEASRRYLEHIREAWNHEIAHGDPDLELEQQDIVLTVPASFDEVARSLTAEAAKLAGFVNITFIEEPQAAFYNWISQNESTWHSEFSDGDMILVCDVGGGTTDFSLIQYQEKNGASSFERMAVGNHLLLGGDNIDTALTYYLEEKLGQELEPLQWKELYHEARQAKEVLLSGRQDTYQVIIQGKGASVVKGAISLEVSKSEVVDFLVKGFFPVLSWSEAKKIRKARGFRSSGLAYEDEPCITKQLAHFLDQSQTSRKKNPQYILFNGGTMMAEHFQNAVTESLRKWFPKESIDVISIKNAEQAVARGAAYYGKVRRGEGVKIKAGSPRTFYLEFESSDSNKKNALCLIERGAEEGAKYVSEHTFEAKANSPVSFTLYASHTRIGDLPGDVIECDPKELHRMPPIYTVLRYGKHSAEHQSVPVTLCIEYTTLGTLELWLESKDTNHRWNLEFQFKSAEGQDNQLALINKARADETFDGSYLTDAKKVIESFFSKENCVKPAKIMDQIEGAIEMTRDEWSPSILRGLLSALIEKNSDRKLSSAHEARWWNMAGYFLRPGFGYPLDDHRVKDLWRIILGDSKSVKSGDSAIQQWICLRRIAGGLSKGQQTQIFHQIAPSILNKKKGIIEPKGGQARYHYEEKIRTLAALERIDTQSKVSMGRALLKKLKEGAGSSAELWAVGRLGSRNLMYGTPSNVVPPDECTHWVEELLDMKKIYSLKKLAFPLSQLVRKAQEKEINVSEATSNKVLKAFDVLEDSNHLTRLVEGKDPMTISDHETIFGDHLPPGLSLTAKS